MAAAVQPDHSDIDRIMKLNKHNFKPLAVDGEKSLAMGFENRKTPDRVALYRPRTKKLRDQTENHKKHERKSFSHFCGEKKKEPRDRAASPSLAEKLKNEPSNKSTTITGATN